MSGFDKDEFWLKILSMYPVSQEDSYIIKLGPEEVRELKSLFLEVYVPIDKIHLYDDQRLMKEMMRVIVGIYKLDKDAMSNQGDVVQLVNSVNYDGENMYIFFAKISPIKLRRFEIGKTKKEIAEKMGYSVHTVINIEKFSCDFRRQPDSLIIKLAKALDWSPDQIRSIHS